MRFFTSKEHVLSEWKDSTHRICFQKNPHGNLCVILYSELKFIDSIPAENIFGLDIRKLEKLAEDKIQTVLEAHFPILRQCSDGSHHLTFSVRGLGGWDKKIHQDKTIDWCTDVGMPRENAKKVGRECHDVDSGKTNPVWPPPHAYDKRVQKWHFNTNAWEGHVGDGDLSDTRIMIAADKHRDAVESGKLKKLGQGLHPLQDLFAHADKFVQTWTIPRRCCNHVCNMEADDPKYRNAEKDSPPSLDSEDDDQLLGFSQRYTNTKLITRFYVKRFLQGQPISRRELSTVVKKALVFSQTQLTASHEELCQKFKRFKLKLSSDVPFELAYQEKTLEEIDDELVKLVLG